jgi:hypothetical protein
VSYLLQLHSFLEENGARLPVDDVFSITEGISCIIRVIQPPEEAHKALQLFCAPLLEQVLRITTTSTDRGQLRIVSSKSYIRTRGGLLTFRRRTRAFGNFAEGVLGSGREPARQLHEYRCGRLGDP